MIIVDDIKKGVNAILHPDKNTGTTMSLGAAAVMYYKFAFLPFLVLSIVVDLVLGGFLGAISAGGTLVQYILYPIGLLIGAGIFFFIGKYLFRWFRGTFSGAFTATVYGAFPSLLLAWVVSAIVYASAPVGAVIGLIVDLWALYVMVVAFSQQQKCTKLQSLIVVLVPVIIVAIIAFLVLGSVALSATGL
jgi:hypothetical protein